MCIFSNHSLPLPFFPWYFDSAVKDKIYILLSSFAEAWDVMHPHFSSTAKTFIQYKSTLPLIQVLKLNALCIEISHSLEQQEE